MASLRLLLIIVGVGALAIAAAWSLTGLAPDRQARSGYLDMHVHAAGIGAGGSGAFINQAMRNSYKFAIYLRAMGVTEAELEAEGDAVLLRKLATRIRESQRVDDAVILAMDGVIGADGSLDEARTQIYVPNDYLIRELARYPNLHLGASINPYRPDALVRLDAVAAAGAVLVKWIPNIQLIDPADPAIEPFYRRMVALELPLLSHAGQERSFAGADDRFGDPQRLELPLSLGVTVIAAHIATTGSVDGQRNFDRILPLFRRYPNLYTDISSLTQINKLNYLNEALEQAGLIDRMIYGSDWPLQFFPLVSPLYHLNHISLGEAKGAWAHENQWDRNVVLKEHLGVPPEVFTRGRKLLGVAARSNR
ncbi:MAG: amidohydrolase family protein [Pseudomonadota bacterium]